MIQPQVWSDARDELAAAVTEQCGLTVAYEVAGALERGVCTRDEVASWLETERNVGGRARRTVCHWLGGCGRPVTCRVLSIFGSWWVCTRHYVAAERTLQGLLRETVRIRLGEARAAVTRR